MASQSRVAQESLAELEKASAPFEAQLAEAWKFIGIDLGFYGEESKQVLGNKKKGETSSFHGREEWLLRWLLKKLQSPKDDSPRQTPSSWKLLHHLVQSIPVSNAAHILSERKFITILRQTLEEAQKYAEELPATTEPLDLDSGDNSGSSSTAKSSKKRKRSVEAVVKTRNFDGTLLPTLSATMEYMSRAARTASDAPGSIQVGAFSAEYMKTVLSTTAEDSAKILGSWLHLVSRQVPRNGTNWGALTSPFVEIWEIHTAGTEDLMQFSLHCLQPLVSILRSSWQGRAKGARYLELEQLVARNVINPSKVANTDNAESDLLSTLTKVPVLLDSANACILFDIAVNSLQPNGTRRRRPQDNTWIQTVFTTLKDVMAPKRLQENRNAIRRMLQSVKDHKIFFELAILRSLTVQFVLLDDSTDWALLSTVIKLDANAFLIPNEKQDLIQEVLTRVTTSCIEPTWPGLYDQVVTGVVIPLMNEFAKARNLLGFVRHWYSQLVEFERLRKEAHLYSMSLFSAWEDSDLQAELAKLLEPSLTVQQIEEMLDWLSTEVKVHPDAVCVLLEAVSGAITREEVIDSIGLRLYHIMFDSQSSAKLDQRYHWRSWRILSHALRWLPATEFEELSQLWASKNEPFKALATNNSVGGLIEIVAGNQVELETLEILRLLCTIWGVAQDKCDLQDLIRKPLLNLLQRLISDVKMFPRDLQSDQELGDEICGSNLTTLSRGYGWMIWAFAQCVFVEHPEVLELGFAAELPENLFKELLQSIFWIASASESSSSPWLRLNPDSFSAIWTSCLNSSFILDNTKIMNQLIDTMLCCQSNNDSPLTKSQTNNSFAVRSLLQLPLDRFSRPDRERVMLSWLPNSASKDKDKLTYESTVLDAGVLSLKIKIMQRPTFYERIKYSDLVHLAGALSNSNLADITLLDLFKELAKSTLGQMTINIDQSRNKAYINEALSHLKKQLKSEKSESNFATIILMDIVLTALTPKIEILNELDVISKKKLSKLTDTSREFLFGQLKLLLKHSEDLITVQHSESRILTLYCIINALSSLGFGEQGARDVAGQFQGFLASARASSSLTSNQRIVVAKIETLQSSGEGTSTSLLLDSSNDLTSVFTRECIEKKVNVLVGRQDETEKLEVLRSMCGKESLLPRTSSELFVVRNIIASCADFRTQADDDSEDDSFDLSSTYAVLCDQIWRAECYRQFALAGETMEMMLRTKGRTISQWNIDSTLGAISILCSRNGPTLRPLRAGSIYLHLCRLLQAIITSHRLKLQGHFHIVVQAMQALLRCLFTPLPHSTSRVTKSFAPPPWLSVPSHQLQAKHAEAFTRLVTLICDPSVSSVTRSQHNNLTSATDKAKRMAGQHMQYLLTLYVKLQLEMKMLPEVREKMVPGIYAIFDTTTPELRRAINDGLDSSGRAVFGTLYRDYSKFGKWKGS